MSKPLHIYYFSTALSDAIYDEIVKESQRFKPTFSGVGFDRNVALGISRTTTITGISLYPIPSYPKFRKLKKESVTYGIDNFTTVVPSMVSLPIVKELNYGHAAFKYVRDHMKDSEENVVLISGLYRSLLRPAKWLKKKCGIPVVAIVPDLPELMITYRKDYSRVRSYLNKIDLKKAKDYRKCVDGFILLSQHMNPIANVENKPFDIMDGLCNLSAIDEIENKKIRDDRYILYAGKISSTFGVDKLVQAFLQAKNENVTLCLCGDGDYANELKDIAKQNGNIHFYGAVSHDFVVQLEKGAVLLVEPRPTNTEIAKMSFPSKIIEYMATGTPLLVTNIPSFAEEYEKYQYRIADESVDGIAKALKDVLSLTDEDLKRKGQEAKTFVLENKTIQKQCEKVISLINKIIG